MFNVFSSFDLGLMSFYFFPLIFFLLFFLNSFQYNLNSFFYSFIINFFYNFLYMLKFNYWTKSIITMFFFSFSFIFLINIFSIYPFNFPFTVQTSLILFLSLMFWVMLNLFSLIYNFKHFFSHLIPLGSPIFLSSFLFLIEIISNVIRPMTLMVRLLANILSGHLLLILLFKFLFIFNFSMFFFYFFMLMVEMCVSVIQSYIFCTLITLYFSEI